MGSERAFLVPHCLEVVKMKLDGTLTSQNCLWFDCFAICVFEEVGVFMKDGWNFVLVASGGWDGAWRGRCCGPEMDNRITHP